MKHKEISPMLKKNKRLRRLYIFVIVSFIVPILFIVFRMIFNTVPPSDRAYHSQADYALMLVQCLLGLAAMNIPSILSRRLSFEIPMVLYALYIVFLYCAIFLGEVRSFYYVIPFWDDVLHCMSSMMTGLFAFLLVTILNRNEKTIFSLSRGFVAVFAFCSSLTIGALWEIYEFCCDGLFHFNMQKFMTADGTVLAGHAALADTVTDLAVDCIGALISALIGFFAIKNDKKWIVPALKIKGGGPVGETEETEELPKEVSTPGEKQEK